MYKIIKILGQGSFGQVFLVKDFKTNKHFASKKITIYNIRHKEKNSLINEIRILKYCQSPYILRLIDFKYNGTNVEIITPYIRRGDLAHIIKKRKKKFDENIIWSYLIQLCLGIQYLHTNHIIHRDIKNSNILINITDHLYIADFGTSKVFFENNSMTQSFVGTPYYLSPEILNKQKYSFKIDIWGIGCVLFEMISFTPPFIASNMKSLSKKILSTSFSKNLKLYSSMYSQSLISLVDDILILDESKRPDISQLLSNSSISQRTYLIPYITQKSHNIPNFHYNFRSLAHKTWHQLESIFNDKL